MRVWQYLIGEQCILADPADFDMPVDDVVTALLRWLHENVGRPGVPVRNTITATDLPEAIPVLNGIVQQTLLALAKTHSMLGCKD